MKKTDRYLEQFGDHPLVQLVKNQRNEIVRLEGLFLAEEKRTRDMSMENERLKRKINQLMSIGHECRAI